MLGRTAEDQCWSELLRTMKTPMLERTAEDQCWSELLRTMKTLAACAGQCSFLFYIFWFLRVGIWAKRPEGSMRRSPSSTWPYSEQRTLVLPSSTVVTFQHQIGPPRKRSSVLSNLYSSDQAHQDLTSHNPEITQQSTTYKFRFVSGEIG